MQKSPFGQVCTLKFHNPFYSINYHNHPFLDQLWQIDSSENLISKNLPNGWQFSGSYILPNDGESTFIEKKDGTQVLTTDTNNIVQLNDPIWKEGQIWQRQDVLEDSGVQYFILKTHDVTLGQLTAVSATSLKLKTAPSATGMSCDSNEDCTGPNQICSGVGGICECDTSFEKDDSDYCVQGTLLLHFRNSFLAKSIVIIPC